MVDVVVDGVVGVAVDGGLGLGARGERRQMDVSVDGGRRVNVAVVAEGVDAVS